MTLREAVIEAKRRWPKGLAVCLGHRCYVGFEGAGGTHAVMGEDPNGCDFDKAFAHADSRPSGYHADGIEAARKGVI